jgi:hypothetical protein
MERLLGFKETKALVLLMVADGLTIAAPVGLVIGMAERASGDASGVIGTLISSNILFLLAGFF